MFSLAFVGVGEWSSLSDTVHWIVDKTFRKFKAGGAWACTCERRRKFVTQIHADLVFRACILFLSGPEKGVIAKGVFLLEEESLESLKSRNSLEFPENGRILLCFPQSGSSLESLLNSLNSLEPLENGLFRKDAFSKRPPFPNLLRRDASPLLDLRKLELHNFLWFKLGVCVTKAELAVA